MTKEEVMAKAKETIKRYKDGEITRREKIDILIDINYYSI